MDNSQSILLSLSSKRIQNDELRVCASPILNQDPSNEIPISRRKFPKETMKCRFLYFPLLILYYTLLIDSYHSIQEFKKEFKNSRIHCMVREEIRV
jgi:hypothetical protein